MTQFFAKPPLTIQQQIALLESRGLVFDNPDQANFYLSHINYYRLRAYWMTFESDLQQHLFQSGTQFADVLRLYIFDRQLRLLLLDAIERFEVSVRTQWSHHLALAHGPHAHLDAVHFRNQPFWESDKARLIEEVKRSKSNEAFIQHFSNQYTEVLPPLWAVCEVMSFGTISRWYGNLKSDSLRKKIANIYGLHPKALESWLHHLTVIRNICAHHCRLWNRRFAIKPELPVSKPQALSGQFEPNSRKLYNSLVFMLYIMDTIAPENHWRQTLKHLLIEHNSYLVSMGFPKNWEQKSIWQLQDAHSS